MKDTSWLCGIFTWQQTSCFCFWARLYPRIRYSMLHLIYCVLLDLPKKGFLSFCCPGCYWILASLGGAIDLRLFELFVEIKTLQIDCFWSGILSFTSCSLCFDRELAFKMFWWFLGVIWASSLNLSTSSFVKTKFSTLLTDGRVCMIY